MITIPGTHDSGAYKLGNKVAPGDDNFYGQVVNVTKQLGINAPMEIVRNFAQSQTLNIYQQLVCDMF